MQCNSFIAAMAALSAGALFVATDIASAQQKQKMTYEQAYERCRKEIGAGTDANAGPSRYTRGSACMKKYGYKLKQ